VGEHQGRRLHRALAGALLEAAYARLLERHGFERTVGSWSHIRSFAFEDTRRKAQKYGARGTTVKAYKPRARRERRPEAALFIPLHLLRERG
jgi:hypothetical protein